MHDTDLKQEIIDCFDTMGDHDVETLKRYQREQFEITHNALAFNVGYVKSSHVHTALSIGSITCALNHQKEEIHILKAGNEPKVIEYINVGHALDIIERISQNESRRSVADTESIKEYLKMKKMFYTLGGERFLVEANKDDIYLVIETFPKQYYYVNKECDGIIINQKYDYDDWMDIPEFKRNTFEVI